MEQAVSNRQEARQQLALASSVSFRASGQGDWWSLLLSIARKSELIPIRILKDGSRSPNFGLRLLRERRAFRFQNLRGGEDIIAPECDGLKLTDAVFMAFWRVESKSGLGTRNKQFDPSLGRREWLIRNHLETHGCGVKLQRCVLVAHRNADELDPSNHR